MPRRPPESRNSSPASAPECSTVSSRRRLHFLRQRLIAHLRRQLIQFGGFLSSSRRGPSLVVLLAELFDHLPLLTRLGQLLLGFFHQPLLLGHLLHHRHRAALHAQYISAVGREKRHVEPADQMILTHVGGVAFHLLVERTQFGLQAHHLRLGDGKFALPVLLYPLTLAENPFELKDESGQGCFQWHGFATRAALRTV